jgi:hypothetical protein
MSGYVGGFSVVAAARKKGSGWLPSGGGRTATWPVPQAADLRVLAIRPVAIGTIYIYISSVLSDGFADTPV